MRGPGLESRLAMSAGSSKISEAVFVATVFLLCNLRSFNRWSLYPEVRFPEGDAWTELGLWVLALLLMAVMVRAAKSGAHLMASWRAQPELVAFVSFALASPFWSESPVVTFHRSVAFASATIAAVYLGCRYSPHSFQRLLFWVCVALLLGSFYWVAFRPGWGTDLLPPYNGAWRGLFWHKNHFGALLPLFILVFLYRTLRWDGSRGVAGSVLAFAFLVLSLFGLWRTDCAAGVVVSAVLLVAITLSVLWNRVGARLRRVHYAVGATLGAAVLTVLALNLNLVLGLLNRNATLTGRVPLWGILLSRVLPEHPWLGAGFGTIWADPGFRLQMKRLVHWTYPVMIADNGFLDVLLNTGIVGFLLFAAIYLKCWRATLRDALESRTMLAQFAPLFLLYTLFANLSFSMFMETELMVWLVLVALLVQVSPGGGRRPLSERDGLAATVESDGSGRSGRRRMNFESAEDRRGR
jgi:exopolysaccharide production protein ExoQ